MDMCHMPRRGTLGSMTTVWESLERRYTTALAVSTRIWRRYLESTLPSDEALAITASAVFREARDLEGITPEKPQPVGGFEDVPAGLAE